MKKFMAVLTMLALGISAYAQGTVFFANTASSLVVTNTTAIGGNSGRAKASEFHVVLYWGPLGSTEGQLVQIGGPAGGTVDGRFAVSTPYITGGATAPGEIAVFQVRGWIGGNYNSFEAAYAGAIGGDTSVIIGVSAVFVNATGGGGVPPAPPPDLAGFTGLYLGVIPEPSSFSILSIGLLGLLWKPLRRYSR